MGVKREDLRVTADPVFRLDPADEKRAEELIGGTGLPAGRKFVAVSVREWTAAEQFPERLAGLCDHLSRTYGLEILFLLMQPAVDRGMTERVRAQMKEKSYLLEAPTAPAEMMAVLGKAKLCLAMRLHTLIFAARMAVPTLGLVYDPKVASFLEELGLPAAGHVERFDSDKAITVCDHLMADYDSVLSSLKEKSAAMTTAAGENEKLLLDLLKKTKL
jgi:polysaccharide pyruvyl transferase WcaK-like protein